MSIQIVLNGKKQSTDAADLLELISEIGFERKFCVMEVDGSIIGKGDDPGKVPLREGSTVEIMRFVGGG